MGEDSLARFKDKHTQWTEWLGSKDRNSILQQVYWLTWYASIFRVILKARTLVEVTEDGYLKLSGPVHNLIDHYFFDGQVSAVRRLVDYEKRDGKHEVFSLWRLVCDMEKNQPLFTRRNLFAITNIPYDYEEAGRKTNEYYEKHMATGKPVCLTDEFDAMSSLEFHEAIDRLCGVKAENRTESDVVSCNVFRVLKKKLKKCDKIKAHANMFVAHAASPLSRRIGNSGSEDIAWDDLWNAHRQICEVIYFLGLNLLGRTGHSFVPVGVGRITHLMDVPLVETPRLEEVEEAWHDFAKEMRVCEEWDAEKMAEEMARLA